MYRKNVSGQYVYFCLVNATNGSALTGATVTAYRALDNGAQAAATGTTTELGNGQYRFALSQADTNADYGSYFFIATSAVPVEKTVVFTAANPQDGGAFGLSTIQAIDNNVDAVESVVNSLDLRLPSALVSGRMDSSVGAMAANTLTASALATDAVTEIQAGLALQTTSLAIKAKTDLITAGNISVLQDRVNDNTITMQFNENTSATVNLDEDTTSATLQFVVQRPDGSDVLSIANASITRNATSFTVTITTAVTGIIGQYLWSLRDLTGGGNRVVTKGVLSVQNAASIDA